MIRIREAAVAGAFYPADPGELQSTVRRLLDVMGSGAWMLVEAQPCEQAA
jgi:predicted class III extradiol MEMO1 family dioxygenase